MALHDQITSLLQANFPSISQVGLEDDDSFLEHGVIDSIGMMELVALLSHEFDVDISDDELMPENLDSVDAICGFLCRKGIES